MHKAIISLVLSMMILSLLGCNSPSTPAPNNTKDTVEIPSNTDTVPTTPTTPTPTPSN